ncbi:MAG TPA: cysteine desulfurase family protein [Acidimicrobiales bacterium]|nr:cysteine desulfurase family protein [Acidimicrobiales bacterium]
MTVYLDHAATTPLRPEALAAMLPLLTEHFGNPSGLHSVSRRARTAVDEARDAMAQALGASPGEVVFTSGGTEADNLAVAGTLRLHPGRVLCSAVEHHAVLDACRAAGGEVVPVTPEGVVDLDALASLMGPDVSLVSVMLANNEVGTVQPLAEVAEVVRAKAPGCLLHTDAVQAFPWLDVARLASCADLVSVSAHKFGGPKGVGALVVRGHAQVAPLLLGGGQERGRRSGTHNVAGIVGMAVAAQLAVRERAEAVGRVAALRDRLADGLLSRLAGCRETGRRAGKVAGNCHLTFEGVEAEELLLLLDQEGLCASAGSACSSGAMEPSHVLEAMGMPPGEARSAVRFSLGPGTTEAEVETALELVPKAVAHLRG